MALRMKVGRLNLFVRLQNFTCQKFSHTAAEGGFQAPLYADQGSDSMVAPGKVDITKWRKLDSRKLGILQSHIPSSPWTVLAILRGEGFDAYLVGGCVRDLLLNRVPKDFDVITTANVRKIKETFHRALIVGRRFPVCRVNIKGSIVEVSSFETVARHDKGKEEIPLSNIPKRCDKKDFMRWRNSLCRDFTINSLFYDPFANKIYDYADGMKDLTSLKLRTLVPAHLSFKEDCARILRGLRIAARLGLSFAKETEAAMHNLSDSIGSLDKARLTMELNYMLSYGAAEPSIHLLYRFKLLEILLPFHAAYLAEQSSNQDAQTSIMLTKLFLNLDKVVSCEHPCHCSLWVGLLAFHLALVNTPQDSLVIWTFSAVLYHGTWTEGVKMAREHAHEHVIFVPEIMNTIADMSDKELAQRVTKFASVVKDSVYALVNKESLLKAMAKYPFSPCSALVIVSKKVGSDASSIFDILVKDIMSCGKNRQLYEVNYEQLGKGSMRELRFVIGKVIVETMNVGVIRGRVEAVREDQICGPQQKEMQNITIRRSLPHQDMKRIMADRNGNQILSSSDPELQQECLKRRKLTKVGETHQNEDLVKEGEISEKLKGLDVAKEVKSSNNSPKMQKMGMKVLTSQGITNVKDETLKEESRLRTNVDDFSEKKETRFRLSALFKNCTGRELGVGLGLGLKWIKCCTGMGYGAKIMDWVEINKSWTGSRISWVKLLDFEIGLKRDNGPRIKWLIVLI